MILSRRTLLGAPIGTALKVSWPDSVILRLRGLEENSGGRLGVYAVCDAEKFGIGYRQDELFPLCSTHKLLTVAAILARIDTGAERPDRVVTYQKRDVIDYSPVTADKRAMTISALCAASLEQSDNTAANLLLDQIGGPQSVTRYLRQVGDDVSRLDRNEPSVNDVAKGDRRDTTSPAAMVGNMRRFLAGGILSEQSRSLLRGWMIGNCTGDARIRRGVPAGWTVGDKTGTNRSAGISNDVAAIWPAGVKEAAFLAVYLQGARCSAEEQDKIIAAVAQHFCALV